MTDVKRIDKSSVFYIEKLAGENFKLLKVILVTQKFVRFFCSLNICLEDYGFQKKAVTV